MKLASIDIGTNTLRLLIGTVCNDGSIEASILKRQITRLGGGFNGTSLHKDARERTIKALKGFARVLSDEGVERVKASATSVVRQARDGADFIKEIKSETGIDVEIIDGETEAELALKGILSALEGGHKKALLFDIGGGSTEYIVSEDKKVKGLKSLNMGVVGITEKLLHSDPPSSSDMDSISREINNFLGELKKELPALDIIKGDSILVGTAGTITTLAALDQDLKVYDSRKINNYILTKEAIMKLFEKLVAMTHSERAAIAALEEGRADLIIAGTLIVLRTMETFGFNKMMVSDYGLLEGLLLDLAAREGDTK